MLVRVLFVYSLECIIRIQLYILSRSVIAISEMSERKRKRCPHCDEFVAVSTFYRHRDLFFREGAWHKAGESSSDEEGYEQTETVMEDSVCEREPEPVDEEGELFCSYV